MARRRPRRFPPSAVFVCLFAAFTLLFWLYRGGSSREVLLSLPGMAPGSKDAPVVRLEQGVYTGAVVPAGAALPRSLDAFLGVPYAQSTAGANRFRPPQPLAPGNASFAAAEQGPCCPSDGVNPESEDCLNLDVFRPRARRGGDAGLMPVAVYVHGGAFNMGRGAERNMASFVAFAEADVVAVRFNYRVGPLGFLPSALAARAGLLNLGLRDQQALFAWVRRNIAAFGGDPDNVTLIGLSAGAHSIGHHLLYYAGRPAADVPFRKAVLESGAATARAVFLPTHPRHLVQFREFLIAAGVEGVPEEDVLEALRALPLATVRTAARAVWDAYSPSVRWPFQAAVDGLRAQSGALVPSDLTDDPLIRDLPVRAWRAGRHLRIPVLTGFNTNEGAVFVPAAADTDAEFRAFFAELIPTFGSADLDELARLYPDPVTVPSSPYAHVPPDRGRQWARLDAAYAHYAYICPVLQTASFLSSDPAGPASPVYVYEFAAVSGATATANHGDNAGAAAHDPDALTGHPGLVAVADAMHGAWARFVADPAGDPNRVPPGSGPSPAVAAAAVPWATFTPARPTVMVFGAGNDERAEGSGHGTHKGTPARPRELDADERARCRFWWDRVELSEGLGAPRPDAAEPAARL